MIRVSLSEMSAARSRELLCTGLLACLPAATQTDWPQWRGPARTGAVPAEVPAPSWPDELVEEWSCEVGGGYSGPVVVGERVWIHAREDGREAVRCLALADGSEQWSAGHEVEFEQDPTAVGHGLGPYATPCVADGRLLTLGVTAVLSAWKADTGGLLWRKDYSSELDPSHPYFGASASPLVWNELCFVHFGSNDGQVPDVEGRGAMIALRVGDGEEVWRWDADAPAMAASPMIHELEGRAQLVFKSEEHIVGLDPRTGEELWRIPFVVDMDNTIVTPLLREDRLLTSDYQKGTHAWRIRCTEGTWSAEHLWRGRESMFMTTPVLIGDLLVGFSHQRRGQLVALDANDGSLAWRGESGWGEHLSLIAWGEQLLVFREDATLVVGEVSREGFSPLHTYRVGSAGSWCHPAVSGRRILLKDGDSLTCFGIGAQ
jgi:outer membrane protein assembly factor BamB